MRGGRLQATATNNPPRGGSRSNARTLLATPGKASTQPYTRHALKILLLTRGPNIHSFCRCSHKLPHGSRLRHVVLRKRRQGLAQERHVSDRVVPLHSLVEVGVEGHLLHVP